MLPFIPSGVIRNLKKKKKYCCLFKEKSLIEFNKYWFTIKRVHEAVEPTIFKQ